MYVCECGRVFDNPQSFNGHKSHCSIHLTAKYDDAHILASRYARTIATLDSREKYSKHMAGLRAAKLAQWIEEQHICETCGKIMTEKFGTGHFCCRACANTRKLSMDSRQKIASSLKHQGNSIDYYKEQYLQHPKYCAFCNKIIPYEQRRKRKTCSSTCANALISKRLQSNPNAGGLRKKAGTGKKGWFRGIYCDSTYELVYVIYNLDHNIAFTRCPKTIRYTYIYNGKQHFYYPDFILDDGSLVEIKGYYTPLVDIKAAAVSDKKLTLLYKNDLQYAFNYVKNNYKYKKLEDLYDQS